jgi:hypothetical protein
MARANPARSPYSATRHLLRNLRNARELRRNPLARDEFAGRTNDEALCSIANRVDAALPPNNARHVAILLRVDAERHDPARVATDLGLSTRQFFRERRRAHDAFYAAYRAGGRAAATVETNFAQRLLSRAAGLADSGEAESASAILHDIIASGAERAVVCEALLQLAATQTWAHRFDRARADLAACYLVLSREDIETDRRDALDDGAGAIALTLRWFSDGPGSVAPGWDERRAPISERTMLVVAAATLRNGESTRAERLLRDLDGRVAPPAMPDLAVDLVILQGELADFTASNPSLSEDLFARAAALAAAHGLRGRELYARHQLALTRWAHSRNAADRRAYRQLVDAVDRSLPARLRSYLTFSSADIELAIGHPQRALESARAAAAVSTSQYERLSAYGLAAGALVRLGRLGEAASQATVAAQGARIEALPRVLSLAQRINAQVYLAQGDRRAARAAIEESIEVARRFSSSHALALAQALWGRIAQRA